MLAFKSFPLASEILERIEIASMLCKGQVTTELHPFALFAASA